MALSSSVYGSVGTCRLFIDYVQFCKAINVPITYYDIGFGNETFKGVWDMNPAKTTYSFSQEGSTQTYFYTRWGIKIDSGKTRPEIQRLLSTANYYAMLGHNFGGITQEDTEILPLKSDGTYGGLPSGTTESTYSPDSILYDENGYRIKTISPN